MNKIFKAYGVAQQEVKNPTEAQGLAYLGYNNTFPSTQLIFPENPYNKEISEAKIILEIGCGSGRNLPWILKNTKANYLGIDPNASMLEYFWKLNKLTSEEAYRTITLKSFDNPVFEVSTFDVILSTFVFQHLAYMNKPNIMGVDEIFQKILTRCHKNTVWIFLEHESESPNWINKFININNIENYIRIDNYEGQPEMLARGHHNLLIFKKGNL